MELDVNLHIKKLIGKLKLPLKDLAAFIPKFSVIVTQSYFQC